MQIRRTFEKMFLNKVNKPMVKYTLKKHTSDIILEIIMTKP